MTEEDSSINDLILRRQQANDEKLDEIRRNCDQVSSENVDLKFQVRRSQYFFPFIFTVNY